MPSLITFIAALPLIVVKQTRSLFDLPSIFITFSNGVKDSFILTRYYPNEQAKRDKKLSCNFLGHLANEKDACVAVTGCHGKDEMEFTINSKNSGPGNKYVLHKDGQIELIEDTFNVKKSLNL